MGPGKQILAMSRAAEMDMGRSHRPRAPLLSRGKELGGHKAPDSKLTALPRALTLQLRIRTVHSKEAEEI